MRILITILALALVLVGCNWFDQKTMAPYTMKGKLDSLLILCQPLPCPPETVYLYQPHAHENADSVIYRTSSTWYYNYMPKGTWVEVSDMAWEEDGKIVASHCFFGDTLGERDCPDSVFIPRKE